MPQSYARERPWVRSRIVERIAAGETVKAVTADPRMPSYATVYRWRRVHEDFAEAWCEVRRRLAREAQRRDLQRRMNLRGERGKGDALAGRPTWRRGRRSSYTWAKGKAICTRLAAGASLSEVVRAPGMPSCKVVYTWMRTRPAFRKMYVEACQQRLELLAFERDLVVDEVMEGRLDMATANRAIAALEGRMGRTSPRKYLVTI